MPPFGADQVNPADLQSLISAGTSSAISLAKISPTQQRAWHWSVGSVLVGQKKSEEFSDKKKYMCRQLKFVDSEISNLKPPSFKQMYFQTNMITGSFLTFGFFPFCISGTLYLKEFGIGL